jgi:hypothetical protein
MHVNGRKDRDTNEKLAAILYCRIYKIRFRQGMHEEQGVALLGM